MRWTPIVIVAALLCGVETFDAYRQASTPSQPIAVTGASEAGAAGLDSGRAAPAWANSTWLNAEGPVSLASLKGRVVLLNFWVFTCINCTNTLPSLLAFDAEYRQRGLSIIGIHTPEFPPYAGEHDRDHVAKALAKYGITYPIAQDNDHATWDQYRIQYWPSFVLIDKRGRIRYEGYGEFHVGDRWHAEWEGRIRTLLAE